MTTFRKHPNNVSTCLAAAYTAGSGSLVLEAGTGTKFGSVFPMTVTVIRADTYGTPDEFNVIYNVTGRNGDTLTVSGAIEGTTDHDFVLDDRVDVRWTDGLAKAVETAVNALENSVVTTSGSYADPAWLTSLAGSKITGTIAPARLGTGTPGATNFLRGDGVWIGTYQFATVAANYTMLVSDSFLSINSSSNPVTITLPSAASCAGREYIFFVSVYTSAVKIQKSGTDAILTTAGTITLTGASKFVRLISSGGTTWFIVGQN